MWPWEHLAVGYVVASVWRHLRNGRGPGTGEAAGVAAGALFPDLVDKPLGWGTTLIPAGRSLAHSLPVALPTIALAVLFGERFDRRDVAVGFAVGYLAHLPADVVYPVALGASPAWRFLLWPFVAVPPTEPVALGDRVLELATDFVAYLGTPRGAAYLLLELLLLGGALLAWLRDGLPGLPRRVVAAVRP